MALQGKQREIAKYIHQMGWGGQEIGDWVTGASAPPPEWNDFISRFGDMGAALAPALASHMEQGGITEDMYLDPEEMYQNTEEVDKATGVAQGAADLYDVNTADAGDIAAGAGDYLGTDVTGLAGDVAGGTKDVSIADVVAGADELGLGDYTDLSSLYQDVLASGTDILRDKYREDLTDIRNQYFGDAITGAQLDLEMEAANKARLEEAAFAADIAKEMNAEEFQRNLDLLGLSQDVLTGQSALEGEDLNRVLQLMGMGTDVATGVAERGQEADLARFGVLSGLYGDEMDRLMREFELDYGSEEAVLERLHDLERLTQQGNQEALLREMELLSAERMAEMNSMAQAIQAASQTAAESSHMTPEAQMANLDMILQAAGKFMDMVPNQGGATTQPKMVTAPVYKREAAGTPGAAATAATPEYLMGTGTATATQPKKDYSMGLDYSKDGYLQSAGNKRNDPGSQFMMDPDSLLNKKKKDEEENYGLGGF